MSTNSAASTACKLPAAGRGRHALAALVAWALASGLPPAAAATSISSDPECLSPSAGTVTIRHVHDGDTVVRADGERIRLIGLDTPELGRDGRPDEAGAIAARDYLRQRLADAAQTRIRYGRERRDHYDRLLGHLYADGENLQAALLAAGLAVPLYIAPNLAHLDCYRQAAHNAREQRIGLWAQPDYQPRAAATLGADERGYRIINGRLQRIGRSRCCIWLNLDDDFALRIERADLDAFDGIDFDQLQGRHLEARGVVYSRNRQLRMNVRHPAALSLP